MTQFRGYMQPGAAGAARSAEALNCIECGQVLSPFEEDTHGTPIPGGLFVCGDCGAIHASNEHGKARELSIRESAILAGDHDQMRAIRAKFRKAHFARVSRARSLVS